MTRSKFFGILFVICSLFAMAKSDVPPDPGYVRQSASLTLETGDDLSDYRFFIDSPMRIEEIEIANGKKTVIEAATRVGAARVGTLLAIPKMSFARFNDELRSHQSEEFKKMVADKSIDGVIKVLSHNFQTTMREEEKDGWQDRVYRLEKNAEKGVAAILVSGGPGTKKQENKTGFGIYDASRNLVWPTIIAGGFISLSIVAFGIFMLRRSSKKV